MIYLKLRILMPFSSNFLQVLNFLYLNDFYNRLESMGYDDSSYVSRMKSTNQLMPELEISDYSKFLTLSKH